MSVIIAQLVILSILQRTFFHIILRNTFDENRMKRENIYNNVLNNSSHRNYETAGMMCKNVS